MNEKINDIDEAFAILFANLKGTKRNKPHDWIKVAESYGIVKKHYPSDKEIAKKVGVSHEIIRSISKLLQLTEENKKLLRERKILLDTGEALSGIKDSQLQNKVGESVIGLSAHDARDLIQYAKKYPNESLEEFKQRIFTSKNRIEKLHLTVVPLKEEPYQLLLKISKKQKKSLEGLISDIIGDWSEKMKGLEL